MSYLVINASIQEFLPFFLVVSVKTESPQHPWVLKETVLIAKSLMSIRERRIRGKSSTETMSAPRYSETDDVE